MVFFTCTLHFDFVIGEKKLLSYSNLEVFKIVHIKFPLHFKNPHQFGPERMMTSEKKIQVLTLMICHVSRHLVGSQASDLETFSSGVSGYAAKTLLGFH